MWRIDQKKIFETVDKENELLSYSEKLAVLFVKFFDFGAKFAKFSKKSNRKIPKLGGNES